GDRALMLAFKANERQVRDKYRRHADAPHPPEVRAVLARAAADEERHYAWALEVLDDLCAGTDTVIGRIEGGFGRGHKAVADAVEDAERRVMERVEGARRVVKEMPARLRSTAGDGLEGAAAAVGRVGAWASDRGGAVGKAGPVARDVAGRPERAASSVPAAGDRSVFDQLAELCRGPALEDRGDDRPGVAFGLLLAIRPLDVSQHQALTVRALQPHVRRWIDLRRAGDRLRLVRHACDGQ